MFPEYFLTLGLLQLGVSTVSVEAIFEVIVPFSNRRETEQALHRAVELAGGLDARITILTPQVVPYPLPLDRPPVALEWLRNRFAPLTQDQPIEIRVVIGLCRDRALFLEGALAPESTIVMRRCRLSTRLSFLGHKVLLV